MRDKLHHMGFNNREIVCLSSIYALSRCHPRRSGFECPSTHSPNSVSIEYYRLLLKETWSKITTFEGTVWNGPLRYQNSHSNGSLMMLETDFCLVEDPEMRNIVEMYAADEELFKKDLSKAWIKLQELGVRRFCGRRRYYIFGPRE